uniref:Uncharacterized protein n=1 Tax=Oryza punctata TaxID=4537 RepID=A0A0E0M917_ORYPU
MVETKLAKFVEEIVAPPGLVTVIIDGEVNDGFVKSLEILSKKLRFSQVDPMINASKSLKDIKPELERLLQKALCKVSDYLTQIFFSMRKPGTNIQILQQNLVQKYRYLILFLREHGSKAYTDVRAAYADTMNKLLCWLLMIRKSSVVLHLPSVFVKEIDRPGLVPHRSEVNPVKYPYLFFKAFFGEESLFCKVFEGPFKVIRGHLDHTLRNCHDAVCLMLMICITRKQQLVMLNRRLPCLDAYLDKVLIYLWPRFKTVFDMYLQSLYQCDAKMLWVDGSHPHHIVRCYVEFTASLVQLNAECGDGQIYHGYLFISELFRFFYSLDALDILHFYMIEAGDEANKLQRYFEEKLESNMTSFVFISGLVLLVGFAGLWMAQMGWFKPAPMDELLMEHFKDLIKFVRSRVSEDLILYTECPKIADVEPIVKNFAMTWKTSLELMHNEVVTSCSNLLSGMAILRAAMAQLLNDYNRLSECVKTIPGGSNLNRNLVSITSISYEMRKYSITL